MQLREERLIIVLRQTNLFGGRWSKLIEQTIVWVKFIHIEQENYLFSLCTEGGMLIIAGSTKNRYVHNRTEGFPCRTWYLHSQKACK